MFAYLKGTCQVLKRGIVLGMNPYPDRINDLHNFLEREYGQKDRQATEILLSCLLEEKITQTKSPRLIIETDYPSLDTSGAWFSLGLNNWVQPLALARINRRQASEELVQSWLRVEQEGRRLFFVDAEWRRMPTSGHGARLLMMTHAYGILLSQCLRLRVEYPKGIFSTQINRDGKIQELNALTYRVLDNQFRDYGNAHSAQPPASFLYYCELLQKLAPMQSDWDVLVGGLVTITRNITLLYNDGRPSDWAAATRVMRDCIPYTTRWILEHVNEARHKGINSMRLFRQSGQSLDRPFVAEVRRLAREGVLQVEERFKPNDPYAYNPWRYKFRHSDYENLLRRDIDILKA